MTEAQKTAALSSGLRNELLENHANTIFAALSAAEADGFTLDLASDWYLDLVGLQSGEKTPLWTIKEA